jgi:uncharacterized protein YbjT (DUF2867 family)
MKYVLTGGAGHITKPLAEKLLASGHQVTVIGRNAEHLKPLTDKGAKAAIGSIDDVEFLTKTFTGADGVYTMTPPKFDASNWKEYIAQAGKNYATAIKSSGVKKVVNLSSVGAHMPTGCGPVSGLFYVEKALNELKEVNVTHLRPGYFFYNLLNNVDMVKHMNIIGGNYGADTKLVLADTNDIADAAAEELLNSSSKDHTVRYVVSDERKTIEIANVLGKSIGKPELPWVPFKDEDALGGMISAGLPEEIAKNYVEMGTAIRSGAMFEDYSQHRPAVKGKVKLEDFAKHFAAAYNAN